MGRFRQIFPVGLTFYLDYNTPSVALAQERPFWSAARLLFLSFTKIANGGALRRTKEREFRRGSYSPRADAKAAAR